MPEPDPIPPPDELGVTMPMQRTPTPAPATNSKPSASHYVPELPLAEELHAMMPPGAYVIESFLGQGGMGAVYKGLQMPLRRPVAVKILARRQPGETDDFAFEERFKREAYAMASLSHPNIVQVYDCGDAGENHLFISMELVEGGDLSDAIKAGRVTPDVALKLIVQICDGLQAAHERGLVHRDIKPANIFLTADGRPKVADFGLAKKFDAQSTFATKTGMSMGTPDYASPEQFDAVHDLDHRADIYSLGVMFYQMLTGTLPRGSFRPASQRVAVDPRIDAVLVKAMEHDRADRYQSAAELKADVLAITAPAPRTAVARPGTVAAVPAQRTAAPVTRTPSPAPHSVAALVSRPAAAPPKKKGGAGGIIAILATLAVLAAGAWMMMKPKPTAATSQDAVSSSSPAATSTPRLSPSTEPWVNLMTEQSLRANSTAEGATWRYTGGNNSNFRPLKDGAVRMLFTFEDYAHSSVQARKAGSRAYTFSITQAGRSELLLSAVEPGKPQRELKRMHTLDGKPLMRGQLVELELRAVGSTLTCKLNGFELAKVEDSTFADGDFGVSLQKDTVLHALEKLDLSKATSPAQPPATAVPAADGPWKDGLAWWFAQKDAERVSRLVKETGGARVVKPAISISDLKTGGMAMRLTLRGDTAKFWKLGVRTTSVGSYLAEVKESGGGTIRLMQGNKGKDLARFQMLAGFSLATRHEVEFRAQGDALTLILDGKTVATATDRTLDSGSVVFEGIGSLIEKLEYLELGNARASASLSSTPSPTSSPAATASATKDAPFINTLGMKFVPVPITGGPTGGKRVLFSVWKTRVQDYAAFITETKREWPKPDFEQGPTHPAVMVSWDDATAFCAWLTERERKAGQISPNQRCRLPSDHEWSCALGIGEREDAAKLPGEKHLKIADVHPWGTQWPPPNGAGNYAGEELQRVLGVGTFINVKAVLAGYNDGMLNTSPVDGFAANRFGLHDAGGNVWQWCEDWFDSSHAHRVLRGASLLRNDRSDLLSSFRGHAAPAIRTNGNGFRCVLAEE